jgi:hypothetical protein
MNEQNIFSLNNKIINFDHSGIIKFYERKINELQRIRPNKTKNMGSLQLRWRDQHTLQEDGTEQAKPNP